MLLKKPDPKFLGIDYRSAEEAGLGELVSLRDNEDVPIFEKVTADTHPQLFENNQIVSQKLGVMPKDLYLCTDYRFCPDAFAQFELGVMVLNKTLANKIESSEQRAILAHERQHFEQTRDYRNTTVSLINTLTTFLHNFGAMIPAFNTRTSMAVCGLIQFTRNFAVFTDDLVNKKLSRLHEYDADEAAVKVAGGVPTLTYGKKLLIHHVEERLEDGHTKTYLLRKINNVKASDLNTLDRLFSGFGLGEFFYAHPSAIKRGRHIAASENVSLEEILPKVMQNQNGREGR